MNRHLHMNGDDTSHGAFADGDVVPVSDFQLEAESAEEAAAEYHRRQMLEDGVTMDEEDIYRRAYRAAARLELSKRQELFNILNAARRDLHHLARTLDCMILAHGFFSILGCDNSTDLAARHHCGDPNINKKLNEIQRKLGLPPASGQREQSGRIKMAKKTRESWHEKTI